MEFVSGGEKETAAEAVDSIKYVLLTSYAMNGVLKLRSARYRLYDVTISSVKCVNVY